MTEAEFRALPTYKHAICRCGREDRLSLMQDIYDYINGRTYLTPLYLCGACHWQMTCEYWSWERFFKREFGVSDEEIDDWTPVEYSQHVMEGHARHQENKRKAR